MRLMGTRLHARTYLVWRSLNRQATPDYIVYKWKNHFSEMKGDVGMSLHEKEGEQEDA